MVLFERSLAPSVCGWKAIDIFTSIPIRSVNAFQKFDKKSLSLSQTILRGKPFSQYQLSKKMTASSSAVRSVQHAIVRKSALRRSVMDRIQL